jgi:hypothetical protein
MPTPLHVTSASWNQPSLLLEIHWAGQRAPCKSNLTFASTRQMANSNIKTKIVPRWVKLKFEPPRQSTSANLQIHGAGDGGRPVACCACLTLMAPASVAYRHIICFNSSLELRSASHARLRLVAPSLFIASGEATYTPRRHAADSLSHFSRSLWWPW